MGRIHGERNEPRPARPESKTLVSNANITSPTSFLCKVRGCNYNCQCNTNQKVFVHGNINHKNALIVISRSIPNLYQILFDKNVFDFI